MRQVGHDTSGGAWMPLLSASGHVPRIAAGVALVVTVAAIAVGIAANWPVHPPRPTRIEAAGAADASHPAAEPTVAGAGTRHSAASGWGVAAPVAGWTLVNAATVPSPTADQGLATVVGASGAKTLVTRGGGSIPAALRRAGWVHIGDPDGHGRYLVDAYQGRRGARSKMFLVTAPGGRQTQLIHPLSPGEMPNNSFAAISPDGRWLVSGEWNTIHRLLVFALPQFGPTARATIVLPVASAIVLSHPMRDVQGCSFETATTLICSTNDQNTDLYPVARQLLSVTMARPLDGHPDTGRPALLGPAPQQSTCPGYGETEGVDLSGNHLRLAVIEPGSCRSDTRIYTYAAAAAAG